MKFHTENEDSENTVDRGFGSRLFEARVKSKMTQDTLGKFVKRGRTSVTQWERHKNVPDMKTIKEIAGILHCSPEWLAYGASKEPVVIPPNPQQLGYVITPEIQFGTSPDSFADVQSWGLAYNWLTTEMHVKDPSKVCIFRSENKTPMYDIGDRLVVDRGSTRLSPAGDFVIWDGVGAIVASVSMLPPQGNKMMVRVVTGDMTYDSPIEAVTVIGRVITTWKKA